MNKSATVRDHEEASVYLKLTVPFGCSEGSERCFIFAAVLIPKTNYVCEAAEVVQRIENFELKPCGVSFYNDEVDVPKKLRLNALLGVDVRPQSWKLITALATFPTYTAHPIFGNYYLDPVVVCTCNFNCSFIFEHLNRIMKQNVYISNINRLP